jgi:hypothetical protein
LISVTPLAPMDKKKNYKIQKFLEITIKFMFFSRSKYIKFSTVLTSTSSTSKITKSALEVMA